MIFNIYLIALFAAAFIAITVCFLAWNRRPARGAGTIVVLLAGVAIWALFQGLTFVVQNLTTKIFLANMRYFGVEAVPIAFYVLAREYQNKKISFSLKRWLAILCFPIICIISVWTNPLHYVFYLSTGIKDGVLFLENGPLFWVNMIYLYVFIVIGVFLFAKACIKSISMYRKQAVILAAAATFPVLANLSFNFNLLPFENIDITPLAFLITAILFFYALFYVKLLEVVPVARDRLVEEMDDIVIVLDGQKRILDLNRHARELILGEGGNRDYVGKNVLAVISKWNELAEHILSTDGTNERITYQGPGRTEYYHLSISNINDKKGNKTGELIVLRNVTEMAEALLEAKNARKEAERAREEAEKAREEAENANKYKGYFLANMSHEIRTPMNAVIGVAEILDTSEDLPKDIQKKYVGMILNSAQSLLTIINDILDFSKVDAGKMEIARVPFNLTKLVNETVETFSVQAAEKSLKLECKVDERLEGFLTGDAVRVRQILTNLIGNSIKFTEEGHVSVAVTRAGMEADRIIVRVDVEDSGIGIPQEKINSVFESFKQVDSSSTRKFGGTGLGLSIVKNLVELMGGSISVESEMGKGSRFHCTIPFGVAAGTPVAANSHEDEKKDETSLSGMKILVAEDNKTNREIISVHLKKFGCKFEFAENGALACEKFQRGDYQLILMDVQMPEMDGLEATRRIREIERDTGKHITIIALTAGAMKEDVESCINAGMDGHLSKPIKVKLLQETLKEHAGRFSKK